MHQEIHSDSTPLGYFVGYFNSTLFKVENNSMIKSDNLENTHTKKKQNENYYSSSSKIKNKA